MSGKAFIIVGGTGSGKTTFVKACLNKVNKNAIYLSDVNNEYTDYYKEPFEENIEKFAEKSTKLSNAVIVFEEATIFFSNRSSSDSLRTLLVRKRHTNNTIFLVFHSLRTIPRYVYDLSNYVILFKTNDSKSLVFDKFKDERLLTTFLSVQNSKDLHYSEMFDIYGGAT